MKIKELKAISSCFLSTLPHYYNFPFYKSLSIIQTGLNKLRPN